MFLCTAWSFFLATVLVSNPLLNGQNYVPGISNQIGNLGISACGLPFDASQAYRTTSVTLYVACQYSFESLFDAGSKLRRAEGSFAADVEASFRN